MQQHGDGGHFADGAATLRLRRNADDEGQNRRQVLRPHGVLGQRHRAGRQGVQAVQRRSGAQPARQPSKGAECKSDGDSGVGVQHRTVH